MQIAAAAQPGCTLARTHAKVRMGPRSDEGWTTINTCVGRTRALGVPSFASLAVLHALHAASTVAGCLKGNQPGSGADAADGWASGTEKSARWDHQCCAAHLKCLLLDLSLWGNKLERRVIFFICTARVLAPQTLLSAVCRQKVATPREEGRCGRSGDAPKCAWWAWPSPLI